MDNREKYQCIRLPQIERDLKSLRKKSRSVDDDLLYAERLLRAGQILPKTDQYPGFGEDHAIYKTRVVNTSSDKGKSGGYRLVYEETLRDNNVAIILILLYSKATMRDETKVRNEIKVRIRSAEYQDLM